VPFIPPYVSDPSAQEKLLPWGNPDPPEQPWPFQEALNRILNKHMSILPNAQSTCNVPGCESWPFISFSRSNVKNHIIHDHPEWYNQQADALSRSIYGDGTPHLSFCRSAWDTHRWATPSNEESGQPRQFYRGTPEWDYYQEAAKSKRWRCIVNSPTVGSATCPERHQAKRAPTPRERIWDFFYPSDSRKLKQSKETPSPETSCSRVHQESPNRERGLYSQTYYYSNFSGSYQGLGFPEAPESPSQAGNRATLVGEEAAVLMYIP